MNVLKRFLKYVEFETTSDENTEAFPTSEKEFELAEFLERELRDLGLKDVYLDDNCYVYGYLPATEGVETDAIGLMAHMDTSSAVSGKNIKPKKIKYEGGDIVLNPEVVMGEKDFPVLKRYIGQELIVTDGTTLLGSDDKAGIAEIITTIEKLINHPEITRGRINVVFNPDEEVGRGTERIDLTRFNPDYAYTVDGGTLGELEYECFNAASLKVKVKGLNVHPGSAKNIMKNAALILSEYIDMFPKNETPSHTEKYEGFYHLTGMSGDESYAEATFIIRDHSREIFEKRKAFVKEISDMINLKYGEGTISLEIKDQYYNMRELIEDRMEIVERASKAFEACDIEPIVQPIRGGTDGSALTYMGLACPNLSAGGENMHGVMEFIPVNSLEKMVDVLIELVRAK